MRRLLAAALALIVPLTAADAAGLGLTVTKASTVISDAVSALNPKALPGAVIDYTLTVANPNGVLSGVAVGGVVISDPLPANVSLRVADLNASGSGPVEFTDGLLLGLLGSGFNYNFSGLSSTTDSVDFYDGTSWTYTPVPDANGYDAKVRQIRVKFTGNQNNGSSFKLRFRVRLK